MDGLMDHRGRIFCLPGKRMVPCLWAIMPYLECHWQCKNSLLERRTVKTRKMDEQLVPQCFEKKIFSKGTAMLTMALFINSFEGKRDR